MSIDMENRQMVEECAELLRNARLPLAFTGAGISVPSGIPDFRSRGGLWTKFNPQEYATLDIFKQDPEKTWQLYRSIGRDLQDKEPNAAHFALTTLEKRGLLKGIITQNIDRLHHKAGSGTVLEIHGDFQHLQCLGCENLLPLSLEKIAEEPYPLCENCGAALKPNIVLFGEGVRQLEAIETLIMQCDLLLVIGTSANVYPAAALPEMVLARGGSLLEFNLKPVLNKAFCFAGDTAKTLPRFVEVVENMY